MESRQSQAWFGIAKKVNALLALSGAKERFRERVKEAAAEYYGRSDAKQRREKARVEAVRSTGDLLRSPRLLPDPTKSFCCQRRIFDPNAPGESSLREAWLPAELSPDLDPDDSLPLPVPDNREVSLAERFAVLAAVWDVLWKGDEKIDPWANRPWPDQSDLAADQSVRAGIVFYRLGLVRLVKCAMGDEPPASPSHTLGDDDRAAVETWLAEVEADLASGKRADGRADGKTSVLEADTILHELADEGAILTGRAARAEAWAQAIRNVNGKTCSPRTVTATKSWTEKGNPRRKRGPEPRAVDLTESLGATVADEKLKELIDEAEEKAAQTVMESRLPDEEKAGILRKLREGEMTAAQATETVRLAAQQHGEDEPSPLATDRPDRPRHVRHHRSV